MNARNGLLLSTFGGLLTIGSAGCTPAPLDIANVPPSNLANGLVAHWALDDGPGSTVVADSSGNGRTGLIAGPCTSGPGYNCWIAGQFGSAYQFTGANYVTVAGFPRATASYTVSAWVLIQANELGAPIANILSTEMLGGGWALYATLSPGQETYVFRYAINPAQGYEVASCGCVVPGAWTHLAAVVDSEASTLTLYVNDVPTTIPTNGYTILPGSSVLYFARSAVLTPTFPLTAALDDVTIYNRALVAEEVAQLTRAPVVTPP